MAVRVVTDSTADLPHELAEALGISVVPLSVIFGDVSFRDGIDITTDEFYERLRHSRVLPTTSAPSVGDFVVAYERLLEEADGIVSVHLSAKVSATLNNAVTASRSLGGSARIEVVDAQSMSLALGLVAMKAAQAARSGATVDEVRAAAEGCARRLRMWFLLDTLEYLRRGGRIGRGRAFLGTVLHIKPILSIRDGEVFPEERARTRARALERIFQMVIENAPITDVVIAHSTTPDDAEALRQRFALGLPNANIIVGQVGPVIGTHAGPGIIGCGALVGEVEGP